MARPSSFNQATADLICERLADGESLRAICLEDEMPHRTTVFRWIRDRAEFRDQYACACDDRADSIFDDMIEIADDGRRDYDQDEEGRQVVDHDHINRAKLRIETRKWVIGRMKPKKYGDRLQLANDPDDPILGLTDEQLDAKLLALQAKSNG